MKKTDFMLQFAARLRDALLTAGYTSPRSPNGVSINRFAELTTYSPQICRKYLRGEALPEPLKLMEISLKLKVSPGWLLFGEMNTESDLLAKNICINKNILFYIFKQARALYNANHNQNEVAEYLLELTNDIAQIQAHEEQLKKIVDLSISSTKHFKSKMD